MLREPLNQVAFAQVTIRHRRCASSISVWRVTCYHFNALPTVTRRLDERRYQPVRPLARIRLWMSARLRYKANLKHATSADKPP